MMCGQCGTIYPDNPGTVGTCDGCARGVGPQIVVADSVPGVCVGCGCTDLRACPGGCFWTDEFRNLCTKCVEGEE